MESPPEQVGSPEGRIVPGLCAEGKRLFMFGMQPQGEIVQYDVKSGQFSPYLPGTRAGSVSFSRSGDWIAYTVSPEGTLWGANRTGAVGSN